jgi:excisionase family DNA binding protein
VTPPPRRNDALDPRDSPRYSVADAARFLGISRSTLNRWIGTGVLRVPAKGRRISFQDLIAAHERVRRRPIAPLIGLGAGDATPIMIDPHVSFGRPTIAGTGIPIAIVASRFRAGESVSAIAEDYRLPEASIHDAIRASIPPVRPGEP